MRNEFKTIVFVILIIVIGFSLILLAIQKESKAEDNLSIFIIDIEFISTFGEGKWCLHYAINGEAWTAFFPTEERAEEYIKYLTELSNRKIR
jgi:hypothetical protein